MTITLDVSRPALPQKKSTISCLPKDVLMIIFREAVLYGFIGSDTSVETYQAISLSCRWHFEVLKDGGLGTLLHDFFVTKKLYPQNLSNEFVKPTILSDRANDGNFLISPSSFSDFIQGSNSFIVLPLKSQTCSSTKYTK